jgi:hypothetical protein
MTLRTLPLPWKVFATCFLLTIGIGYLLAIVYLYLMDVEPHAKRGLGLVQAVILKYYGNPEASKLEAAVKGGMGESLSIEEKQQVIRWVRQGAKETDYVKVDAILKRGCSACHSAASGLPIPNFASYQDFLPYTAIDLGESLKSLVRVSHIHLFGMSFIFALTGVVFAFSETSAVFRSVLIAVPFLSIWIDIGSWWFTKYQPMFAYTVIVGGVLMGLALAGQIGLSLYEMWLPTRTRKGGL